jgi:signal-transduction protein with cAMP-binding, CBS, and nucleotidyltransferase domain
MAILTMEEYKTPVLIILDEDKLIGLVKEDDILEMSDLSKPINPILLNKQTIYLNPYNHFFEALKLFNEIQTPILPIIDREKYIGYISINNIVNGIGALYQFSEIGILIIECPISNYSLSEISRIIELNNGLILSSFSELSIKSKNIIVHLVINQSSLTRIKKALNRYSWNVVESYTSKSKEDDFNNRLDSFIRYLNT